MPILRCLAEAIRHLRDLKPLDVYQAEVKKICNLSPSHANLSMRFKWFAVAVASVDGFVACRDK